MKKGCVYFTFFKMYLLVDNSSRQRMKIITIECRRANQAEAEQGLYLSARSLVSKRIAALC